MQFVIFPLLLLAAGFMAVIVLAEMLSVRRRARQGSLLWLLAIATKKNLPLGDEVEQYGTGLKGRERRDLLYLADQLNMGDTLPAALSRIPGLAPQHAVLAAHAGLEGGCLSEALRDAAMRHQSRSVWRSIGGMSFTGVLAYLGVIVAYTAYVLLFQMYYIIPKFKMIFEDFETDLPEATRRLIDASDWVVAYYYLLMPPVLIPLALIVLLEYVSRRGFGEFDLGPFGAAFARLDTPGILRNLATIVAAGLPIERGLDVIHREHRRVVIRKRAGAALADCERGSEPWDALATAGLIRPAEEELLRSAAASGSLPWALRELADTIEYRRGYRLAAVMEVVRPVLVFALGLLVFAVAVPMFLPLVKLLNDLS